MGLRMSEEDVARVMLAVLEVFVFRTGGRMTVEQLERATRLNLTAEQREGALRFGERAGFWELEDDAISGRRIVRRIT